MYMIVDICCVNLIHMLYCISDVF